MSLDPMWAGIIGALGGSLITGIVNLLNNHSIRKSEERKHLSSLTVTAAIKHWERLHDGRKGEDIMPIDIYMVHMSKLAQEVLGGSITKENIKSKLQNIDDIVDEMKKYASSIAEQKNS